MKRRTMKKQYRRAARETRLHIKHLKDTPGLYRIYIDYVRGLRERVAAIFARQVSKIPDYEFAPIPLTSLPFLTIHMEQS